MASIFVSYSRADVGFIDEFVRILEKAFPQHHIWYDDHITGGDDWWNRILGEIQKADLFIYLLSNDSITSEYCWAEFREALRLHKRCLPVLVRPKTQVDKFPPDLQPIVKKLQWVDLSQGFRDYEANAELFAAISNALVGPTPAFVMPVAPVPAAPPPAAPVVTSPPVETPAPQFRPATRPKHEDWRSRLSGVGLASVVIGLAAIALLVGGLYLAGRGGNATSTLSPTEVPTSAPVVLRATDTPQPSATPALPPTLTPVPMLFSPVEFIGAYYARLNNKDYATAWDWLSPIFQAERNPGGYTADYVSFWSKVQWVSVSEVVPVTETADSARVHAQIRLEYNQGSDPAELPICLDLVRSTPYWLINYTCSVPLSVCQDTASRPVNTPCE
jgi:hypothetical protein